MKCWIGLLLIILSFPAICQTTDSVYTYPETLPMFISDNCEEIGDDDFRKCCEQQFFKAISGIGFENITWKEFPENTKLILSFVIEKNGSVSEVEIIKSVHALIDGRYIQFIKSSKWIPATNQGKSVRSKFILPVQLEFQ